MEKTKVFVEDCKTESTEDTINILSKYNELQEAQQIILERTSSERKGNRGYE